jgi:small conductance mechanosensitive channel
MLTIEPTTIVLSQLNPAIDHWLSTAADYLIRVIEALFVIAVGWIFAKWARRRTLRSLCSINQVATTIKPLIADLVKYGILILTAITVLAEFGVQTASIITVLGGATVAIGLALQGTLSNIAAGIMLLFLRPFNVGDYINAEGIEGTVKQIGIFTTIMTTFDGIYQEVPNSKLWNCVIKNYSRLSTRRIEIVVGIGYEDDIDRAKSVLQNLLNEESRVLAEPASQVKVVELAASSVNLNLRCWVNSPDYYDVLCHLTEQAKKCLEAAGISIPFPQQDINLFDRK